MGLGPGGGAAGRRRGLNLLIGGAEVVEAADQAVLSWIARARTPALTDAAEVLDLATGFATVMALRCVVVVVLALYRRFRHLAVFLGTLVVTDWVVPGCCASSFPGPRCRSWSTRGPTRSRPGRSRPWPSPCSR